MTTGHVFLLDPNCCGIWGVLTYGERTEVRVRILETGSVYEACRMLSESHAGKFVPADSDTTAWGRVVYKARGQAEVITG